MAFIQLHLFSEALGMQTECAVVLPQQSNRGEIGVGGQTTQQNFKCLYLLHGLSDDHTIWMRRTSIERYATEHSLCVVMPCGGKSFYTDMKYGMKYYTYIAEELPAIMEQMFRVSKQPRDRYIGGLSMGGYGALKIALRACGRYAAAFGLSSVADIRNRRFDDVLQAVFGDVIPDEDDLFWLATDKNTRADKPRIYMTVGRDDFMYLDNVKLSKHFETLSYDYTYVETDGAHTWALWDTTVQAAIRWMLSKNI